MKLTGRRTKSGKGFRVFFATDVHGSERCFRKFLAAARVYEADALILGGDIAGKAIVPVRMSEAGVPVVVGAAAESVGDDGDSVKKLQDAGLYPRLVDEAEYARLSNDEDYRESVFEEIIIEQTTQWCALAGDRLHDDVRLVITPGNDDPPALDDVLRNAPRVECPERQLLELGPVVLASLGNVTPTPWHTPREFSEEELAAQIEEMVSGSKTTDKLVFNFHCPPYGSGLDAAPKVDEDLRPVVVSGQPQQVSAGSRAVLQAIDHYRPVVGLHGHIHESAGVWRRGETVCLNPGSDYGSGALKGAFVIFNDDGSYRTHILTTG